MTTMEIGDFINLGFNKNEAKVYLSLIKFKRSDASQLIKDTKFHKNIIYDNLEKLIDKGLVTFIVEKGRKVFAIASPDAFLNYFEEQEKELNKKKELAQKIAKEVKANIREIPYEQEATISKGIKAVRSFYNNALNNGDYLVFGAPQNSIDIMGRDFWMNHNVKRKDKKIKVRMIFNESIRYHGEASKNKYTTIKYFDKDFEPLTEVHIQNNIVAMIVWTKEPFIFKINSKIVAESYKEYFNKIWKLAKK